MKALFISFVVGLLVGVVYGVIRVKSTAPPIVLYSDCSGWC
jgi:XapX domain-containing protein